MSRPNQATTSAAPPLSSAVLSPRPTLTPAHPRSSTTTSISSDNLLIATAIKSGRKWSTIRDFVMSLAITVPGSLQLVFPSKFVQVYQLPQKHRFQRFLIHCADHADTKAKPHIGTHYDTATALITKVENSHWPEAIVRYAAKGEELDEALEVLRSASVLFNGAAITLADVRKEKARLKRSGGFSLPFHLAAKAKVPKVKVVTRPAEALTAPSGTKRKREGDDAIKQEARQLAKRARNAGTPRVISEADKQLFVRYLADLPASFDWDKALSNFIENGNDQCRYTYPTWAFLLRQEKTCRQCNIATAFITKVEDSKWNATVVRYVRKGEQLEEAGSVDQLKSAKVQFHGSSITTERVERRESIAGKTPNNPRPATSRTLRGRYRAIKEFVKEEARRLSKIARNTSQEHLVTEDDKKLLTRHLTGAPHSTGWKDLLTNLV
ncbi:hypothetical protein M407DRAFT_8125 [Tulasnella calospora MUT 4182]|uniref:Uncharacterized protein n=1 Tax=Tulasnella calospora MUT 4182 TaxID=1051891 RepID=A0A0C3QIW7_9AGAM|nr:hypothetical protein M407DRAFT_8125 [Tulasnella calospora MUT 4182]